MSSKPSGRPMPAYVSNDSPSTSGGKGPLIVGAIVGLVVVIIAVVVVVASRQGDTTDTATGGSSTVVPAGGAQREVGAVTVEGDKLAAFPDNAQGAISGDKDPATGSTVPTIRGTTFDGSELKIEPGGGPQIIMAVAHWCPHCQAEVPRVREWLAASPLPAGARLVTLSTAATAQRPNYPPSKWLAREKWTFPVLLDSQEATAFDALGGTSFPYFVFTDASGKVTGRASGELEESVFRDLVAGMSR